MSNDHGSDDGTSNSAHTPQPMGWAAFHDMAVSRGEGMNQRLMDALERDERAAREREIEHLTAISTKILPVEQPRESGRVIAYPVRSIDPDAARAPALGDAEVIHVDFTASAKARREA